MEITTNTIAELYIKQGYPEKAIDIYKAILEIDPANSGATKKIAELEASMQEGVLGLAPSDGTVEAPAAEELVFEEAESEPAIEAPAQREAAAIRVGGSSIPDQIARLEGWLMNINRVRGLA